MVRQNLLSPFLSCKAFANSAHSSTQPKLVRGTSATFLLSTIVALGLASASVPANAYNISGITENFTLDYTPAGWVNGDTIQIRSNGGYLGYMNIMGGAVVNSSSSTVWEGGVLVTGGSIWNITSNLTLGVPGSQNTPGRGTLTIADNASVSVGWGMRLGDYDGYGQGSTGTLNIGAAVGSAAVAPGTLTVGDAIYFGSSGSYSAGDGTIVFNHADDSGNYIFTPQRPF